jgi:4a-hydroxytetrahydrobiopterin dehydratase
LPDRISPREFHDAHGVDEWRVLGGSVATSYATGSFAAGLALVDAIGNAAADAEAPPHVDVRAGRVTVRIMGTPDGLPADSVALARAVSAAARQVGVPADPSAVQDVQLTIDALVSDAVMPFWRAVLGYEPLGDEDLVDPHGDGPPIWFQDMKVARTDRNRIHVDVFVPHDLAETRVAAAVAAGGTIVRDHDAPACWGLVDPEGNEVDVATWMGRD